MATKITRDVIESYLNCKYKGHLKLTGESGTQIGLRDDDHGGEGSRRGSESVARLVARFGEGDACQGTTVTAATLKQGAPLLADVDLEDEGLSLRCDALKRADGASKLGDHHYVPVLHNDGDKVGPGAETPAGRPRAGPRPRAGAAACRRAGRPRPGGPAGKGPAGPEALPPGGADPW